MLRKEQDNSPESYKKLIHKFLESNNVNRLQEILAELKSILSQPTMVQSLDSLIQRFKTHSPQESVMPACFELASS